MAVPGYHEGPVSFPLRPPPAQPPPGARDLLMEHGEVVASKPRWVRWAVPALLALHAALLLCSARLHFVVVDEVGHLGAGLSHWQTGTFVAYRVNPPLPRALAALPLWAVGAECDASQLRGGPGERCEWDLGRTLRHDRLDYVDLVFLGRLAGIVWSLLGGWLIYRWASELYGAAAGCFSLALWCLGPTVLAFAGLNVPDVPSAVAGLAACYAFWRYLQGPSWAGAWFAGLLLGVAQLTKFTLLVLYGVWPLLWLLRRWSLGPGQRAGFRARTAAPHGLLIVGLSLFVISLGYAFQDTGRPLGQFVFRSAALGGTDDEAGSLYGNRFRDHWTGQLPVPLPADYLQGIDVQRRDFELGYYSYLRGEWRKGGWWYYYLYALSVKVPVGVLALAVLSLGLTLARPNRFARWTDEVVLLLPAGVVLVLVSSQTGFNHHLRYVLPLFPFVCVSMGKLVSFLRTCRWPFRLAAAALWLWSAASSLAVHPHHLSYFNELAGGPDRGHEHLVDSNIDWGQDLLFLRRWLERHPEAKPLYLAHYNGADPRLVGIDFSLPPAGPGAGTPPAAGGEQSVGPVPGWFAVDVNFVQGAPYSAPDGGGGAQYFPLGALTYFQHFTPVAKAGYSIFIYHITAEEANQVRQTYGLPLLPPPGKRSPPAEGGPRPRPLRQPHGEMAP